MNASGHTRFILTPISDIIRDTCLASISLGSGIESQPMAAYVMQTTYLRMTGASEQKLKCICWELASFDYEFRYEMLQNPLGECSSYRDKNGIFTNICKTLRRYYVSPALDIAEKNAIIKMASEDFITLLSNSQFSIWFEKEMKDFCIYQESDPIKMTAFCNPNASNTSISFLEEKLKKFYEDFVYSYRNRYAHNLTSYQLNIPTFSQLSKFESDDHNHFRMMSLLILLDAIFITYFRKFLSYRIDHSY